MATDKVEEVAVWTHFIVAGYLDKAPFNSPRYEVQHDDAGEGHDGFVKNVARITVLCYRQWRLDWEKRAAALDDWPGVFEYEVLEEYGRWIADLPQPLDKLNDTYLVDNFMRIVAAWFVTDSLTRN